MRHGVSPCISQDRRGFLAGVTGRVSRRRVPVRGHWSRRSTPCPCRDRHAGDADREPPRRSRQAPPPRQRPRAAAVHGRRSTGAPPRVRVRCPEVRVRAGRVARVPRSSASPCRRRNGCPRSLRVVSPSGTSRRTWRGAPCRSRRGPRPPRRPGRPRSALPSAARRSTCRGDVERLVEVVGGGVRLRRALEVQAERLVDQRPARDVVPVDEGDRDARRRRPEPVRPIRCR